jgi:hypothetical protein
MFTLSWFKSWLRKWLAIDTTASMHGAPMSMEQAAADIANRARLGDQVAMAIICEVRDNAKKGDPKAKQAFKLLDQYTREHANNPENLNHYDSTMGDDEAADLASTMCGEEVDYAVAIRQKAPAAIQASNRKAIVTLANGPSLLPGERNLVREVGETFQTEEEKEAFILGARFCAKALAAMQDMTHEAQHALLLGYVLGTARKIQAVREPNMPISVQSRIAGWELGED